MTYDGRLNCGMRIMRGRGEAKAASWQTICTLHSLIIASLSVNFSWLLQSDSGPASTRHARFRGRYSFFSCFKYSYWIQLALLKHLSHFGIIPLAINWVLRRRAVDSSGENKGLTMYQTDRAWELMGDQTLEQGK